MAAAAALPEAAPAPSPQALHPACVVVLGEALVDAWPDGTQVPGGAPFNVARWLAAFGVPVVFITRLGLDDAAQHLRDELRRFGLNEVGVQTDPARPTGRVQVLPDAQAGHRFEIEDNSAWDHIDPAVAVHCVQQARPQIICFGSLALRHADSRAAITQCLAASTALRVLDLNLRDVPAVQRWAEEALHLADWVKVNEEELARLLAWFGSGLGTLAALSQRFGVQRWIVTRGAQGWFSADALGRIDAQGDAVPLARLQDTVGAGDAFTATVLAGHAHGWPLAQSLQAANRLAAAVCGWRGALPADNASVHHWRTELGFGSAPE